jgi:ubiquinone/menaquinone biosynthesis C-methylase UbiE
MGRAHCCDTVEHFSERYGVVLSDGALLVEQAVIGGDWGANGYTTMAQADRLATELELGPGSVLADIGCGRGWPGLYLAALTGSTVVLSDVPKEALRTAKSRAGKEGLGPRATVVCANGVQLPFASGSFDAVVHTDVLCCVRPKLTLVRECARVLRPGGRMAFFSIHPAAGLTPSERRRASRDGPIHVALSRPHRELLARAGFLNTAEYDVSEEFATVSQDWIDQWDAHRADMEALWGRDAYVERQRERRAQLRSTQLGILRRSLVSTSTEARGQSRVWDRTPSQFGSLRRGGEIGR